MLQIRGSALIGVSLNDASGVYRVVNGSARTVVLVGSGHDCDAYRDKLVSAGWDVHIFHDPERAIQFVDKHGAILGLLCLTRKCVEQNLPDIENMVLKTSQVRWIGLMEQPQMDDPRFRRFISRFLDDYHTLPVDIGRLSHTMGHCSVMAEMMIEERLKTPTGINGRTLIAGCACMQALLRTINKISNTDAPAIITGETGTGKELVARAIHDQSSRKDNAFIAVNCGSLPASLIQTELFGHKKGSFTGAFSDRVGRIEAANGGTIFLDEIGDLSIDLQVNLLRFLQEGVIERVGSTESIRVDVRVLAATHVDLTAAILNGKFREDLYYRLNVLPVELPPLRQREADIERLAVHYFEEFTRNKKTRIRGFSKSAIAAMYHYQWPGNVRELLNRVRRGIVMCDGLQITPADLELGNHMNDQPLKTLAETRLESERNAIQKALVFCGNNVSEAARHLRVSRITLYRLIDKHNLRNKPDTNPIVA